MINIIIIIFIYIFLFDLRLFIIKKVSDEQVIFTWIEKLEPRIMYDGAAVATADQAVDLSDGVSEAESNLVIEALNENEKAHQSQSVFDALGIDGSVENEDYSRFKEVVIIDASVKDPNVLISGISRDSSVEIINLESDGLAQIAEILQKYSQLEAIHIISHGSQGELNLGNATINENNLAEYQDELSQIGESLSINGDILFYGCNVAEGEKGQAFITLLEDYTGADIAASTDLTGNSNLGGDWDLEYEQGVIESEELVVDHYNYLLSPVITAPASFTVNEDVQTALNGISVGDDSIVAPLLYIDEVRLEVGQGILNITSNANVTVIGSGSNTVTITADTTILGGATAELRINQALATLTYQGISNFNGEDTLTITANNNRNIEQQIEDEETTTNVTITVNAVNDNPSGLPVITGTANRGQVLTANTGGISDADGLGTFSYQWHAGGQAISGATNSTYTLTLNEVGETITVTVSYTDGGGTLESITSVATDAVTNINNAPNGVPTITGNATQGEILTANTDGISDADGLGAFSYQWHAGGQAIAGATSSTYTLTQDEVGETITVTVSYTDGGGASESVTSVATSAVININDNPVGVPVITGDATQGQILTANTDGISDADGLTSFSYQWYSNDVAISGATNSTYILTQNEVGKIIRVTVSYTDGGGTLESITSANSVAVQAINVAPVNSVPIAQNINEDNLLSITGISVSDASGGTLISTNLQVNNGSVSVTPSGSATISAGANNSNNLTITGSISDVNATLASLSYQGDSNYSGSDILTIISTDNANNSLSDTDTLSITISAVNDNPVGLPTIIGILAQGQTLTAVTSGISDADGLTSFSYQWHANGKAISGANTSSYTLTQSEIGQAISVTVSYTDSGGTTESITSALTNLVARGVTLLDRSIDNINNEIVEEKLQTKGRDKTLITQERLIQSNSNSMNLVKSIELIEVDQNSDLILIKEKVNSLYINDISTDSVIVSSDVFNILAESDLEIDSITDISSEVLTSTRIYDTTVVNDMITTFISSRLSSEQKELVINRLYESGNNDIAEAIEQKMLNERELENVIDDTEMLNPENKLLERDENQQNSLNEKILKHKYHLALIKQKILKDFS